jgi:hypothetical protein
VTVRFALPAAAFRLSRVRSIFAASLFACRELKRKGEKENENTVP